MTLVVGFPRSRVSSSEIIPARLVFGAGEMWLWWEQPPTHPAYALAVGAAGAVATSILGRSKTLVKRICQAAPPRHT